MNRKRSIRLTAVLLALFVFLAIAVRAQDNSTTPDNSGDSGVPTDTGSSGGGSGGLMSSECTNAMEEVATDKAIVQCNDYSDANLPTTFPTTKEDMKKFETARRDAVCDNKCDWSAYDKLADDIEKSCGNNTASETIAAGFRMAEPLREGECLKNNKGEYCTLVFLDFLPDNFDLKNAATYDYSNIINNIPEDELCDDCMKKFYEIAMKVYDELPENIKKLTPNVSMWNPLAQKCGFDASKVSSDSNDESSDNSSDTRSSPDGSSSQSSGSSSILIGFSTTVFALFASFLLL